ncbi:hypothetical protein [Aeromonas veronii]|uniref:hypothetical protein n=1 Tax=Aeromonas veronii TaxID=654 RepID=UPI00330B9EEE|nr:hypothetical protein [Aeromonas veronii]
MIFIFFVIFILYATNSFATVSSLTPALIGHKPVLSPDYKGRLLVGDNVEFVPGYYDEDGDLPLPDMTYHFYTSMADGELIQSLQFSHSLSLFLTPQMSGKYIAVRTQPRSISGVPDQGDEVTYVLPYPVGHLQGVTALGTGLYVGSDGSQCILDGFWTTGYAPNCIAYRLGYQNFGWVAHDTFFEVSYSTSFAARKFVFRGYWRQSKPGSLGIWAVYGCHDIACSNPEKITESKPLSFADGNNIANGELRVINVRPYYRYRFVYEGGAVDANGGTGAGSFNEIEIE